MLAAAKKKKETRGGCRRDSEGCSRHGRRQVALYEPLSMLGGMGAAGNLALNDGGNNAEHTGLALAFTLLNGEHYNVTGQVSHPEAHVALATFNKMLGDAGVATVKTDCRCTAATTALAAGVSRIETATVRQEQRR